jgi:hypothetical protein
MITAVNSRTPTLQSEPSPYVTSESINTWGQPPVSHYGYDSVNSRLIKGVYAVLSPLPFFYMVTTFDPMLKAEIKAWEAASDDDLAKFEASLA